MRVSLLTVALALLASCTPAAKADGHGRLGINAADVLREAANGVKLPKVDGVAALKQEQDVKAKAKNLNLISGLTAAAYGRNTIATTTTTAAPKPAGPPAAVVDEYDEQGDNWIEDCVDAERQSPIDIANERATEVPFSVAVSWTLDDPMEITNTGHTLKVTVAGTAGSNGKLTFRGQTYELLQFHFHAPSEHTFNGDARDAEVHFVHRDASRGEFGVATLTFSVDHGEREEVKPNAFLQTLIDSGALSLAKGEKINIQFPEEAGLSGHSPAIFLYAAPGVTAPAPLPTAGEIPTDVFDTVFGLRNRVRAGQIPQEWKNVYTYKGSLTTPPCTEAVSFFIQERAIRVPRAQIDALLAAFVYEGSEGNWRTTQNQKNEQVLYKTTLAN